MLSQKKEKVANVYNFAEETVPGMDDNEFRRHFRIGKSVFNILIQEFEPFLVRHIGGRGPLSVYKQLLIFLWHISTLESMRETANLFGVSTSTVHDCVHTTAKTISDHAHKFIKWPKQDRRNEIATSFQDASRIPSITGVIDGTHIRLVNPIEGERDYINRKGYPSMQLQLIVDDHLLITDAYVGWPGATHDARVLRNSPIYEKAENNLILRNDFIFGDSAYPLRRWLQTPFRDNGCLNQHQRRYNRSFSKIRQTVERAKGHLKGRFRRLQCIHCTDAEKVCRLIMAACVLHNLCILTDDDILSFIDMDEAEDCNRYPNIYGNAARGEQRRNALVNVF